MNTGVCPIPGAFPHANLRRILPPPSDDIKRQFHRIVYGTGLSIDASIGVRDPRLQHCILLPAAGLLVTATRASAPLLEANCVELARITDLCVLLLRFSAPSGPNFPRNNVNACLILNEVGGHIVAHEGYLVSVPSEGGILLRHELPDRAHWHVSQQGMVMADRGHFDEASANAPDTVAQHSR